MVDQPDYDDPFQEVHSWARSQSRWRSGVGRIQRGKAERFESDSSIPGTEGVRYTSVEQARNFLTQEDRIARLLNALYRDRNDDPPNPETIRQYYLRPFLILISIKRGSYIGLFTTKESLEDKMLPLTEKPGDFPSSANDELWELFSDEQWTWYPQLFRYGMDDFRVRSKRILPVQEIQRIGRGGTSDVFKIKLDPEYDKLADPQDRSSLSQVSSNTNRTPSHRPTAYVLKRFRGAKARQSYETEKAAYKKLQLNSRHSPNFLCLHGSFVWHNNCYLIFDHADSGTLENYLQFRSHPKSSRDILEFWRGTLSLIYGLHQIHHAKVDDIDKDAHRVLG